MRRAFATWVSLLLASMLLAGCMHSDDKDDDDTTTPDPGTGPGDDNNTTDPGPNLPPVAAFTIALENGTTTSEPFFARPGNNVTIKLDGSSSHDPDGNITEYVWRVTKDDKIISARGDNLSIYLENAQSADFGLYHILLRVVDEHFNVTALERYFALSYEVAYTETVRMVGPGTAARNDANEIQGGSALHPSASATRGTYTLHDITIRENATQLDLHMEFDPTVAAQMKIFVFKPADKENHATADPHAASELKVSPIDLTVTDLAVSGTYRFRLELEGDAVDSYILTAKVTYSAPGPAAGEDESGDEAAA